jgi:hypothetical protein
MVQMTHYVLFIKSPSSLYRIPIRKYSSNSKAIIDEFFLKLDDKLKTISSVSDKSKASQYQDEVIKLLHEKKPQNGSPGRDILLNYNTRSNYEV